MMLQDNGKGWPFGSNGRFLSAALHSTYMPSRKNIIKVVILVAVAALVLGARFLTSNQFNAARFIVVYGYWAIAFTFAGFAILLVRQLPAVSEVQRLWKAHRAG